MKKAKPQVGEKKPVKAKPPVRSKKEADEFIKHKFSLDGEEFDLTEKQKLFAQEYVRNKFNAGQAALAAGYSKTNYINSGCHLLGHPDISRYVQVLKRNLSAALGIDALDIAREYAKIGFSDIRKIFDENGALIKIKKLDSEPAGNISSIEIFEVTDAKGKVLGHTKKVKLYDKINALDKLARMIGVDGVTKVASTDPQGQVIKEDPLEVKETVLRIRISGKKTE